MKTLNTVHPIWHEALAICEALRRLGFTSDDIMLGQHPDGRMMICLHSTPFGVAVCLQEDRLLAYVFKNRSADELLEEWRCAVELWNTGPEEEAQAIWAASTIHQRSAPLLATLHAAGIIPPSTADA
jgi:hypothetical protein